MKMESICEIEILNFQECLIIDLDFFSIEFTSHLG